MSEIVDLRSDTVTRPGAAMLAAMAAAPVGDDVLGDDPTVAELERVSAGLMGHEAGVFVPSGTMGNQIAIATHTTPGDVMLVEEEAHVLYYEVGGPAIFNGVNSRTVASHLGIMDPGELEKRVMQRSLHTPGTTLCCVENTHNRAGGAIIPLEVLAEYRAICDRHGMKLHLDGARVFNASVALGIPVSEITRQFDSVSFCLSKGLGTPVGSVLTGSAEFIERARIWRKRLGGGMRQSGYLAAAGLYALQHNVEGLAEDHRRARTLAEAVDQVDGLEVDWATVQTNMVLAKTELPAADWLERLRKKDVWALPPASHRMRFVLHRDIDDAKLERAIWALRESAKG